MKKKELYESLVDFSLCLLQAIFLQQKGDVMELVDPKLGSKFKKEEAKRMIKVALLCTNPSPALRPTMSTIVSMLEGRTAIPELILDSSNQSDPFRFTGLRDKFEHISQQSSTEFSQQNSSEPQSLTHSSNTTSWIGSSST